MPASTDYWINDRSGDPLLVITGEVDAALTKALPQLLREVRDVVGERRFALRPPPRIGLAFPGSPVERSTATAVAPVP